MWEQRHGDAVRAALLAAVLVAVTLAASACGGTGGPDAPSPSAQSPRGASDPSRAPASQGGEEASPTGPPRTPDDVLRRLAGRRIEASGKTVRIEGDTATCGGLGSPTRRRGRQAAWTRFRCIQPTFPAGGIAGPDLIFVVESVEPRRLVVTRRYFTSY